MENPVADNMVTMACARCRNIIDVTGLQPGDGITCPYCGNEFLITRQFGNFLLERQIGAGGMGAVYLGRDVSLNRIVAVKVLKPELVSDQKFLATFLREAEITASLNHPNVVQVYAFGQHEGVYYMVVEYISGGSLDDKIAKLGQITELEGIEIGIAVARGLECALQRGGLIHRDIKPGNILFNSNNTPKVVDFGLSLSFETTDHFDGEIWGTPYYVAPEKLEREPEDFRSDLYSLGATLFHAISGRPPYEGEDPNEVAMKHLSGNVISLKAFVPDISDQTAYAVSKAMARYPEDRYESYAAFIEQLEDAKRRITDPNFRTQRKEDVAIIETDASAKYNMWLVVGMVAIVVIVLGLLAWKGSSLLKQGNEVVPEELSDYAPKSSGAVTPKSSVVPPKPPLPKPTPPPAPAPVQIKPPVPPPPAPSAAVVTPSPTTNAGALPPNWADKDIGQVGPAGSAKANLGTFTLSSSGAEIWGKVDSFHFVYQSMTGDGAIIARLVTQPPGHVKSGLMFRENLMPNSKYVILSSQQQYGARFEKRDDNGIGSAVVGGTVAGRVAPVWLKLTRVGNTFTGFTSPDGTTWTREWPPTTLSNVAPTVYVGLVLSALNNTKVETCTFDSVSVVPGS